MEIWNLVIRHLRLLSHGKYQRTFRSSFYWILRDSMTRYPKETVWAFLLQEIIRDSKPYYFPILFSHKKCHSSDVSIYCFGVTSRIHSAISPWILLGKVFHFIRNYKDILGFPVHHLMMLKVLEKHFKPCYLVVCFLEYIYLYLNKVARPCRKTCLSLYGKKSLCRNFEPAFFVSC